MTQIPADELSVLPCWLNQKTNTRQPFTILEFGNKKNTSGTYREWYTERGCKTYVSVDWNGKDGALPLDCNFSLTPEDTGATEGYDIVTNFGFSEHVSNQPAFWKNNHDLCDVNGTMCGVTPAPGFWPHHGILQPSIGFYHELAAANHYGRWRCTVYDDRKRPTCIYSFTKVYDEPFVMPEGWEKLIIPTKDPTAQALKNSGL